MKMISPQGLKLRLPINAAARATVERTRRDVHRILSGEDCRLMVIVGPCSIHDTRAARDYAGRLSQLSERVGDSLLLIMRTYIEKPRTTMGWRGFATDPHLDGSNDIETGLAQARELLIALNACGVPCATETLDPLLVSYTEDLVSWTAIGARTVESQTHRAMASGLPMPVGFKNGTNGDVQIAVDAQATAMAPQVYIGLDESGSIARRDARGNRDAHVVLRGGRAGPNYSTRDVALAEAALRDSAMSPRIVVDCNHANSGKQPERQVEVLADIASQITAGNESIVGVMLESFLHTGNQSITAQPLAYGVSVTDGCLGWDATESALETLRRQVGRALERRSVAQVVSREVA
jgi:3-deoxy-7-phosphoheptulonate synthase